MPRQFWKVATSAIAVLLVGCATACGSSSGGGGTNPSGILVVDQQFNFDDLDPALAVYSTSSLVDHAAYDTLTIVNPHDLTKAYPSLATSWTVSTDAKTTTFHLRNGVKFASGNPLTSADVVWSLTRLEKVGQKSGQNYVAQDPGGNDLAFSAPDPYTVVVTSQVANPSVAIELTMVNADILDSALLEQHGATTSADPPALDTFLNSGSAGSGPYTVTNVDRTSQIVLTRSPRYWGSRPTFAKIVVRDAPTATQRLDIQDGQAQLALDIPATDAATMNASSVNVDSIASPDQLYIMLNAKGSVLPGGDNQKFRDAVRYALDYRGLVALAGKGAVQNTGFLPNGILGALPESAAVHQDLALARSDLQQSGVANPGFTLEYPTDVSLDGLSLEQFAVKIQSDLAKVGITVTLRGDPQTVWGGNFTNGNVQARIGYNNGDFPDPNAFMPINGVVPNSDTTVDNWVPGLDPNVDQLTNTASAAITAASRNTDYQTLERAMNSAAYFDFILEPAKTLVTAKSVHASANPFTTVYLGQVT